MDAAAELREVAYYKRWLRTQPNIMHVTLDAGGYPRRFTEAHRSTSALCERGLLCDVSYESGFLLCNAFRDKEIAYRQLQRGVGGIVSSHDM